MALPTERIAAGDETWVLAVTGELDAATAPELRAALGSLIDDAAARWIAVDLTAIAFLDSSALAVLANQWRRLRERGALTIVGRGCVCDVFDRTGLSDLLGLHLTRDEALAYLADRRDAAVDSRRATAPAVDESGGRGHHSPRLPQIPA